MERTQIKHNHDQNIPEHKYPTSDTTHTENIEGIICNDCENEISNFKLFFYGNTSSTKRLNDLISLDSENNFIGEYFYFKMIIINTEKIEIYSEAETSTKGKLIYLYYNIMCMRCRNSIGRYVFSSCKFFQNTLLDKCLILKSKAKMYQ